jgi:hypothetical protein
MAEAEVFSAVLSTAVAVAKLLGDRKQANREIRELNELHSVIRAVRGTGVYAT